ncbi:hypothetical protein [Lysinibacter sp. HNR]|uniref:hypothetical protein n=1 Tax=Lysinibacter sp. HNR TaxID=3031408 RepID=UPI0024357B4D|nr:hypothetical protein [Lysinibacter sp. HNR]WGD37971.1 hypothetical protein FrondiHNR_03380 [Lysinibacter sp. HNR]
MHSFVSALMVAGVMVVTVALQPVSVVNARVEDSFHLAQSFPVEIDQAEGQPRAILSERIDTPMSIPEMEVSVHDTAEVVDKSRPGPSEGLETSVSDPVEETGGFAPAPVENSGGGEEHPQSLSP